MSELSNPHDRFFKDTFSRPEIVRDFLSNYLPAAAAESLDFNTLELQSDSFIDQDLQTHFSDLLYQVQTGDGRQTYVYLLLEHKSYPDAQTPVQLLGYMVRIWERDLRQKVRQLRPILPLVLYHGRRKWNVTTDFGELFDGPEGLRPYWPSFNYELQDLRLYSDEEIRSEEMARVTILTLKHIFDPNLEERLPIILMPLTELANVEMALEYLETWLYYIDAVTGIAPGVMKKTIEMTFGRRRGEMMDRFTAIWKEEALKEGRQEGLEQGLQQGLQEGLQQGLQQGQQQGHRDSILEALKVRFDASPMLIAEHLAAIDDIETLRTLLRQALTANSLATFEHILVSTLSAQ